jgi:hypothetical protein
MLCGTERVTVDRGEADISDSYLIGQRPTAVDQM